MHIQATETITYLTEANALIRDIKGIVDQRNKTSRFLAMKSMLLLVEARIEASIKYARAGGDIEFTVQEGLYSPIIAWLAKEVNV
tara:strand:+ start:109574 stop:109828 length:255 start_codon:yes stop_codon:yes gene_type:complete